MRIHIVETGDTVASIARQYNIPITRLEIDNELTSNQTLNIGRAIMISPPKQTYIIKEGDTLKSIAEAFNTNEMALLGNNPQLSDRNLLYVGEELNIDYERDDRKLKVIGYTTVFVTEQVLKKTLPYLTYLAVYNYRVDALGNVANINDERIIKTAIEFGVAPIMFISSIFESGRGSYATTHAIMTNLEVQNKAIENILEMLKAKGYYGLNIGFFSILPDDLPLYKYFVTNITERLNQEGFEVFITLTPHTIGYKIGVAYDKAYFAELAEAANYVVLITYLWQRGTMEDMSLTTADFYQKYLDFALTQIPSEKIYIGLTPIAYDWGLPYVSGVSQGNSLTNSAAINLANQLGSPIEFDQITQTPYFYYNSSGAEHFVWFKDSRSVLSILNLIEKYKLAGIAVWNIMYYNSPTWLTINSNWNIIRYQDEISPIP